MGLLNVKGHLGEDPKKYIPYDSPKGKNNLRESRDRQKVKLFLAGISRFVGADIDSIMDGTNKKY